MILNKIFFKFFNIEQSQSFLSKMKERTIFIYIEHGQSSLLKMKERTIQPYQFYFKKLFQIQSTFHCMAVPVSLIHCTLAPYNSILRLSINWLRVFLMKKLYIFQPLTEINFSRDINNLSENVYTSTLSYLINFLSTKLQIFWVKQNNK